MQVAVVTFDGFNEIDSFVAAHILNRLRPKGWKAFITSPSKVMTSMNGVVVHAERRLDFAAEADAVIIGSGVKSARSLRMRRCSRKSGLMQNVSSSRRNVRARCCSPHSVCSTVSLSAPI